MPQVTVTISPDGEVKVEAGCIKGHGCKALTAALEAAIGRTVADTPKPEMFQQGSVQANATSSAH